MYSITIRRGSGQSSMLWLWWVDQAEGPSSSGSATNPAQAALCAADAVNIMRQEQLEHERSQAAGEAPRKPYGGTVVPRGRKKRPT